MLARKQFGAIIGGVHQWHSRDFNGISPLIIIIFEKKIVEEVEKKSNSKHHQDKSWPRVDKHRVKDEIPEIV